MAFDDEHRDGLIGTTELFAGLDRAIVQAVLASATSIKLRADAKLLSQGDASTHLHLVTKGRLKMTHVTEQGEQVLLRFMGVGDLIGCAAVFRRIPYPATATAVTDAEVLSWTSADIQRLIEKYPGLGANALKQIGGRTEEFMSRFRELATEPVPKRLARALLRLCEQPGQPTVRTGEVELSVTRQDLAELTGTTLYTVSRIISAWEQEGVVRSGRRRIVIADAGRLRRSVETP